MNEQQPAPKATDETLFQGASQDVQRLAKQARKELRTKQRANYWSIKQAFNQQQNVNAPQAQ
jgi:hypothetical protein